jgi:hypothetical protein
MAATDREPGGSTMIRVSNEVKDLIEQSKIIPREPLNDCIKRILKENQTFRNLTPGISTRERMIREVQEQLLNPDYPDPYENHREIWLAAHPGETLTQDEMIHHINGDHYDNRQENLKKVSNEEHGKAHAELNKQRKVG